MGLFMLFGSFPQNVFSFVLWTLKIVSESFTLRVIALLS